MTCKTGGEKQRRKRNQNWGAKGVFGQRRDNFWEPEKRQEKGGKNRWDRKKKQK